MLLSRMDALTASGFPVLDHICALREEGDPTDGERWLDVYRRLFDSVPVGIAHLLLHPSVPGYDIEAVTGAAAYRIADYETFLRPELKEYVAERGIYLIGYRRLRDLLRS